MHEGISFDDYVAFVLKNPTDSFCNTDIYKSYKKWFNSLTEIRKLKEKKSFTELSAIDQEKKLNTLFYDRIFAIEKDKMLYFILTCSQKTVITKVGEKQEEKNFIGYEFSKRRGHEGIKMLSCGTKLYDEENSHNTEKANSYIYNAFLKKYIDIDGTMKNNIKYIQTNKLIDFEGISFEKIINLNLNDGFKIESQYPLLKISEICSTIINGSTPSKSEDKYWNSNDVPWVTIPDLKKINLGKKDIAHYVSYNAINENKLRTVPVNSVLLSCTATIGKVSVSEIELATNQQINSLICRKDKILPYFLAYYLQNYGSNLSYLANNSGVKHINQKMLQNFLVPVPPIKKQQEIISEMQRIENLASKNLPKIEELKKMMLDPEFFNFDTVQLEKLALMIKRGKSAKYGKSDIQIIKSGQARGYNEIDFSEKNFVEEGFVVDERNLQKGDILINSTGVGTAGRVTLFNLSGKYVVDSHITIVRLNKNKVEPKYVLYALANIGFKNIESMAKGQSGQIELSLSTIKALKIPFPALSKQREIVHKIQELEREVSNIKKELATTESRKKEILDKYLS